MTLFGYFAGGLFASRLQIWGDLFAALLLFFLGGRALFEAFRGGELPSDANGLIPMGFATSVDASAVGVALSLGGTEGVFYLQIFIILLTILELCERDASDPEIYFAEIPSDPEIWNLQITELMQFFRNSL